ncbi:MAG: hypothetical protein ARM1_0350 [Candidatus Micrarchaeota archaeon]|nr:MAG: hypothetical protein ARM1_0350 [Candidatus Micrarchaeota archaeon]
MRYARHMILIAAFMLLYAALARAQAVSGEASQALQITNLVVQPQPVYAGENVTISFNLYNSYEEAVYNVILQAESQNPLLNVSPTFTNYLSAVGPGQYGGLSVDRFFFNIHVPSNIQSGLYEINFIATYYYELPNGQGYQVGQSEIPIYIYIYSNPKLSISASAQSLNLGSINQLELNVQNTGGPAYNLTLQILNNSFFKPYGSPIINLGDLQQDSGLNVPLNLYVNSSLRNTTAYIEARVSYENQLNKSFSYIYKIPFQISILYPNITVSQESLNVLYPGNNGTIALDVVNNGYGAAKDINVNITANNISILSNNNFYIPSLNPLQSQPIQLFVVPQSSINSYITADLSYKLDNSSNYISKRVIVPINVAKGAVIKVVSSYSNATVGSAYAKLVLGIKNEGNEPADGITLDIQTNYPITPLQSYYYISNLTPGEVANATFYISVQQGSNPGLYPISLYYTWKQPNGAADQLFSGSSSYYVNVTAAAISRSSGKGNYGLAVLAVIIIIVAAYIFSRRGAKRSKK